VALWISTGSNHEFNVGVPGERLQNRVLHPIKARPAMLAPKNPDLYVDSKHSHRSKAIKVTQFWAA
jgi:hypothetical protein